MDIAPLREIVVIRALPGIGDLLCAVPALRSLRLGLPGARITLLGLPEAAWFVDRFPQYLDALMVLPHWPTIHEASGSAADTLALLSGTMPVFDLAVQLHGSGGAVNAIGRALGAGLVVGHDWCEWRDARHAMREWPARGHEIERLSGLVRWMGCPDTGTQLELPAWPADEREVAHVVSRRPLAIVHPGASRLDRRWSPSGFAKVVDRLSHDGLTVVLTGSDAEEGLLRRVRASCTVRPLILEPAVSIGALAALVRRAVVVVANDTGIAHIGVAVGTPTVVIGTSSDLERWGPMDRRTHAVVPTGGAVTPATVGAVVRSVRRLVAASPSSQRRAPGVHDVAAMRPRSSDERSVSHPQA